MATAPERLSPILHGFTPHLQALVNRDQELALARGALLEEGIRLLTLAGPPGIGKTRLAVAIAESVALDFPDGVWFVDLSRVDLASSVPSAIQAVLTSEDRHTIPSGEHLDHILRDRRMLLLLDTFEHVQPAAAHLAELLGSHAALSILVTSRQPLRLKWEHVMTVAALATLPEPHEHHAEELAALPSVRLFAERAEARRIDFALTPENVVDVAAICAWLEGVPLAIELAAGWVNVLPPSAILKYLHEHLELLRNATRDVPARQQSLTAALDWSFNLLSKPEQVLLRRLSVFDGFTLDAAAAVSDTRDPEILDGLAALVDRSLLQSVNGSGNETRFSLSHTVRAYAAEQLAASSEADATNERHAQYFLALAEQKGSRIRQAGSFLASATLPPTAEWSVAGALSALGRDHANLLAALRWLKRTARPEEELRLTGALSTYWWSQGHLQDGSDWLEDALRRNPAADPELRIRVLNGMAMNLRQQGDFASARLRLLEALPVARAVGEPRWIGDTLVNLATVYIGMAEPNLSAALDTLRDALASFSESGDTWGAAVAQLHWAVVELNDGHGEEAEDLLADALSAFEQLGDRRAAAATLLLLGHAIWLQGDAGRVSTFVTEGLRVWQDIADYQMLVAAADLVAWLYRDSHPQQSAHVLGAANAMVERGFTRPAYSRLLYTETMESLRTELSFEELELGQGPGRSWNPEDTAAKLLVLLNGPEAALVQREAAKEEESEPPLTDRELEVLRLVSEGLSTGDIAQTIFVSAGTVKLDLRSIYRKLKVQNRAQAMAIAVERDLI